MHTMIPKALIAVLVASTRLFGLLSVALAGPEVNVTQGLTLAGTGLAFRGYDPVAYCTDGRPVMSQTIYSAVHSGATYRFATQPHLHAFEANPEKYVPHYGGFCAYGVAVGAKFDRDPMLWKIVDGKLYLNLNPNMQKT
jgi:YHS domain-containing protein